MRQGTCKHYNGSYHNTHCEAGVCYRDVTTDPDMLDGSALRIPCITDRGELTAIQLEEFNRRGTCNKYEEPTAEEIAVFDAEVEEHASRFLRTIPLITRIKSEHKGDDWKGTETCPECGGVLHLSHAAYNGHVWGQCETDGCLSWME